jgi:hypothetical protein
VDQLLEGLLFERLKRGKRKEKKKRKEGKKEGRGVLYAFPSV